MLICIGNRRRLFSLLFSNVIAIVCRFKVQDEFNVRGGVEKAFMSFSSDPAMGKKYSKSGLVLEGRTGLVTRGASLESLSYYPWECEVCFPPCTALDVLDDFRLDGAFVILSVALTTNPSAATIDRFVEERRSFVNEALEIVKSSLTEAGRDLFGRLYAFGEHDAKWYNIDTNLHKDLRRLLNSVEVAGETDPQRCGLVATRLNNTDVLGKVMEWGLERGYFKTKEVSCVAIMQNANLSL